MKCPYHDCQKDYNPEWGRDTTTVTPSLETPDADGLLISTSECGFCGRKFHQVYSAKRVRDNSGYSRDKAEELLLTFPSSKTKFDSKGIPKAIKDHFNEAERCASIGSLTGLGACLRKTVYAVCDDKGVAGKDYREKIGNLPVKGKYQALLKQIKWLGDNTTKPGAEKYTMKEAGLALEILPLLLEELYAKDEKIEAVEKVLAKVKAKKAPGS